MVGEGAIDSLRDSLRHRSRALCDSRGGRRCDRLRKRLESRRGNCADHFGVNLFSGHEIPSNLHSRFPALRRSQRAVVGL
jgi:hypothetical protein